MKKYQTFVANSVRYGIVRKARSYNMTDPEIWDVVTSWKKEALHEKLFTCVSNVMSTEFFGRVIGGLGKKISSDRATVENTETKEDLFLAFDIFSYLTFCQNEAMFMLFIADQEKIFLILNKKCLNVKVNCNYVERNISKD